MRSGSGGRGPDQHGPHCRPDPGAGQDRRHHRGARGGRLPRDAELCAAPRPARSRRPRRARCRSRRRDQPARLRDRRSAGAQATGRGAAAGGAGRGAEHCGRRRGDRGDGEARRPAAFVAWAMRRLALVLAAAVGLAATCAGAVRADTFVVIAPGQAQLPSYEVPNSPGSVRVPQPLSRPPAHPAVLSYPELVDLWRRAGSGYALEIEGLGKGLAQAPRAVARARRAIPALEETLEQEKWDRIALEQRAGDPTISDDEFARLEARIAALEGRASSGWTKRLRREQALADAEARVSSLEAELEAALAGAGSDGSPDSVDGYVFPVGGGPEIVSVAHDHHDYPAADIAAPEGTPVYALASGTVLEVYSDPHSRCGLGLKVDLAAGRTYVYCHLSYVEPSVAPGVAVSAGASLGLVGSTGNSTGPHLHLQFVPADAYPQEEPWFQSFAGRAFSWQDAPTPQVRQRDVGRVFRVIRIRSETAPVRVVSF